jgi:hypothetical protein
VGGLIVTAGGSQVTVSWNADPSVTYWMMYAPTGGALDMKNPPGNHVWVNNGAVTSPITVTGLLNGTTYAFAIDGRVNGGPGGAQTPTVWATPRPSGNYSAISPSWSTQAPLSGADLHGVSYGTNTVTSTLNYLAVGASGQMYSGVDLINTTSSYTNPTFGLDSVVWTPTATLTGVNLTASLYALGEFFAVGTGDPAGINVYHSTDLVTWTPALTLVAGLNALATNGTTVVGVGDNGLIRYSTDGATWYGITSAPAATNLHSVAYSPLGFWVAVGDGGAVWYSLDALTWTSQTSNANGNILYGVTAAPTGQLIAVGQAGTIITSPDGITWTLNPLPTATTQDLRAVNADGWQFLAVGTSGTVYTAVNPLSTTSAVWTAPITWTPNTLNPTTRNLYAIYGSSIRYLVVGQSGANLVAQ